MSIKVLSDASKAAKDMDALSGRMGKLSSFASKAAIPAAAVGAALVAFGKSAVKAASDSQQSLGATEQIFGKFSSTVIKTSQEAASKYGLSANQYRESSNLIGSLFKNQGVAQDQLAAKTQSMIGVASDLSAVFGGTASDAVEALSSAFKGEFDPLEKYGISLKQSTVNTEAFRVAGVKTQSEFNKLTIAQQRSAQQQATTNLIMKQSAAAQGQFAAQTNTLAEKQQIAAAQFENLKATLGSALLPILTQVMSVFAAWAAAMAQHATATKIVLATIAGLAGGILALNAAIKLYTLYTTVSANVTKVVDAGQKLWNNNLLILRVRLLAMAAAEKVAAVATQVWGVVSKVAAIGMRALGVAVRFAMGPVGLILTGITLLVAALIFAYRHNERFRKIVDATWKAIRKIVGAVLKWLPKAIRAVFDFISKFIKSSGDKSSRAVSTAWRAITGFIRAALRVIQTIIRAVFSAVAIIIRTYINIWVTVIRTAWRVIQTVTRAAVKVVQTVVRAAFALVTAIIRANMNAARTVLTAAFRAMQAVARSVMSAIRSVVSSGVSAVMSAIGRLRAIAGTVSGAFRSALSAARSALSSLVGAVRSGASSAVSAMRGGISGLASAVRGGAYAAVSAMRGALGGLASAARGAVSSAVSAARGAIGGMASIGYQIIAGLAGGIRSAAGQAVSAAVNAVRSAVNAAKSALGIGSPSKVFREMGVNTGQGMVIGIRQTAALAQRAAAEAARGTIRAADAKLAKGVTMKARIEAAPPVRTATGAAGGPPIIINISALDPEQAARKINATLTAADRRRVGVRIARKAAPA